MTWTELEYAANGGLPYLEIADYLEHQIRSGRLKAHERLPTTAELGRHFHVTAPTMQKSLSRLTRLGLLRRTPRHGTFVAGHLHADTVAVVTGSNPFSAEGVFPKLVLDSFYRLSPEYPVSVGYYVVADPDKSRPELERLEQDLKAGKIRTLFKVQASPFLGQWLQDQRNVPWLDFPTLDYRDMVRQGVRHLLQCGRKNLRVLSMLPVDSLCDDELQGAREAYAAARLKPPATLLLRCGQREKDGYRIIKELFAPGQIPPDGLLVNHDVLMRGAMVALLELGIQVPDQVAVVAHENQGAEIVSPFPLTVLSMDIEPTVRKVLDFIAQGPKPLVAGRIETGITFTATLMPRGSCGEKKGKEVTGDQ